MGALLQDSTGISSSPSTSFSFLQERAGCKMQMIQDGQFANAPEKPLRMTGLPESCKVLSTLVLILLQLWFEYMHICDPLSKELTASDT